MFDIYIDNKPLKTPEGKLFRIPSLPLAQAIEEEWKKHPSSTYSQKPLTSLAATALDRVAPERERYIASILQAIPEDVILFWAATPDSLVKLQEKKWTPIIKEVNLNVGLSLKLTKSLTITPLLPEEEKKIKAFLRQQTDFILAGLSHGLTLTSSFCLTFLSWQHNISPQKAWDLAHLHEHFQKRVWGEDKETIAKENNLRQEFLETIRFLHLSQ